MKQSRKRRFQGSRESDGEVHNNWSISYGDMITLLLGFFAIFYNVNTDSNHLKLLKKDLDKQFEKKAEKDKHELLLGITKKASLALPKIGHEEHKMKIETNLEGDKLIVEFPKIEFFKKGEFELTNEGITALTNFAKSLSGTASFTRYIIRGYTDSTPVKSHAKSRYKDNLELSALRSISAIRQLNAEGLPLRKMRIAGYGETDISDRSQNKKIVDYDRKIAIVIEPLDQTERGFEKEIQAKITPKKIERKVSSTKTEKKASLIPNKKEISNFIEGLPFYERTVEVIINIKRKFNNKKRKQK